MKKRITIALIILLVALAAIWKANHFNRFEKCMTVRGYEYSDSECEVCWEDTRFKTVSQ